MVEIRHVKGMKRVGVQRTDIINSLPTGGMKIIATRVGCERNHVSMVLHGKRSQVNELGQKILTEAQMMAAINIWNERFCQSKPTLNPKIIRVVFEE